MRKTFTQKLLYSFWLSISVCLWFSLPVNAKRQKSDSTYAHFLKLNKNEKSYLKTAMRLPAPVLHTYFIPPPKNAPSADDKLLTNIQVFPNPITDQINVKYSVSRTAIVSIKIMDVLGNEVLTLVSQRIEAGDQKCTASLNSKIKSGFYFVRIVAGSESVIRRISIL